MFAYQSFLAKVSFPAKAGTQEKQSALQPLGPRFRGGRKFSTSN